MTQILPHPDPMPLREALRTLRHGMRRSARALREAAPAEALPGPAALLARPVLDGLDHLARGVDEAGTDLARRLLGGEAHRVPSLAALLADPRHEEAFAEAAYAALRGALRRMGDGDAFVSEAAARRAFAAARAGEPGDEAARAAELGLALAGARAVRDVAPEPGLRVPAERVPAIAVFAALLWLLADRGGGAPDALADEDAALGAAADIAVALAGEVAPAVAARDASRLAALLREFAPHV